MASIVVNSTVSASLYASRHRSSLGSSSSPMMAASRVRLCASGVSLGAVSHRQGLQIVAQGGKAKGKGGAKKKAKSPPAAKGFGAAAPAPVNKEPEQLDVKSVESYVMFKLHVRANSQTTWHELGRMVVEDPATIGAAMKERRAGLKSTANSMPQIKLVVKGNMDGVQYGAEELVAKTEDEEEAPQAKPIVEVPLGGKIEAKVPALINISNGLAPPSGSIWSRNSELYGGNQQAMPGLINSPGGKKDSPVVDER